MRSEADVPTSDPWVRVRRNYIIGLFISSMGEGMVFLTSSFLIFSLSGRATFVAFIPVLTSLPSLVLAPVANRLAHRFGGPRLYLFSQGSFFLLMLVPFALDVAGHLTLATLLGWYLVEGIVLGLGSPAISLLRTVVTPKDGAAEFNGAATRAITGATMVGILVGGAVLARTGPGAMYLLCALGGVTLVAAVLPLRRHPHTAGASERRGLSEARAVVREIPDLRAAFRFTVMIFLLSGYAVTLPAVAASIGTRPIILSALQAAVVGGGLFVMVGIRAVHRRATWLSVQRACLLAAALAITYLGWVALRDHQPAWYLATALLAIVPLGFALNLDSSLLNAAVQVTAPSEMRSPVLTLYALIPMAALPASELLIGGFSDLTSPSVALLTLGIVALGLVLLPRRLGNHASLARLDAQETFPDHAVTIGDIDDAGQPIAGQVVGPEITIPEERFR